MAYVLHYFVILCFTLRPFNCVKRRGNINLMLQSLNFEFNYKHLNHFLNLHLFSDGEESTTNFFLNYSSSLTNINVLTQYRVLYYSTLLKIISFVYTAVHTYSQFISACTLSCEKKYVFLTINPVHYSQSIDNVS